MHIAGIIAALAALAVAAPLGRSMDSSVKRETSQPQVQSYGNYGTYYFSYGNYPSVEEAQTAAISLTKRGYSCYTSYTPYPVAMEAKMAESRVTQKRGYGTYSPYCIYGAAVEAEAMKADNMKRDMVMAMPKELIMHTAGEADVTKKRDMSVVMETEHASKDFSYKSYK
ncbi:uncharacterized protein yc1106_07914 [Curvularia clavata]|uniref:Uncharacterized protein n=1 Tax=Curvularia clavata TaxID=95742 RepID=A0A9Q8ZEA5_CURCL|nr:uncharacterized protein yc1106_07914 [Curvularia clavata]